MAMPMGQLDYKFNVMDAAHFAGAAPIAYCGFLCWIIWTHEMGYRSEHLISFNGFCKFKLIFNVFLLHF